MQVGRAMMRRARGRRKSVRGGILGLVFVVGWWGGGEVVREAPDGGGQTAAGGETVYSVILGAECHVQCLEIDIQRFLVEVCLHTEQESCFASATGLSHAGSATPRTDQISPEKSIYFIKKPIEIFFPYKFQNEFSISGLHTTKDTCTHYNFRCSPRTFPLLRHPSLGQ